MTGSDATPPPTGPGVAGRMMIAQTLVLTAGAVTTWLVASLVGPSIFRTHLGRAQVANTGAEAEHVEEAFVSALLISLSVAVVAAVGAALLVSWYFSRRIRGSIGAVTEGARGIAAGRYDGRVTDPGLGPEFETLTDAYNQLAERLGDIEMTRRRLLSDLAHEMRTPLAAIDAHLEAIEDGVREPNADTLEVIRSSSRRLRLMAEDLGALSQAEEGGLTFDLRRVAASSVVDSAVAAATDRFRAHGTGLATEVASRRAVRADPDRLGQVMANLLDNALRHTPAGGHVLVRAFDADDEVAIQVADDGDGIAAAHLPHVFERFYRIDTARDRDHGGSGIGLSIAKALVEAHGGSLVASSAGPGAGTTFTVRLPALRD